MKFMCTNCNYRFNSEEDQTKKKCPYCGEKNLIKEPDAEDLIKEVD